MDIYDQLHIIEHLMAFGNLTQAIEHLQNLSREHPENYYVCSMLGECYLHHGKPELAVKPLEWATRVFFERDLGYRSKKPPKEEKVMIQRLRDYFSEQDVWFDHYLLGCAYARLTKFRHAMRHLNIANEINPDNTEILRNMGWIHCMQEKKLSGRRLLQKAITLDPENALAYNDLGASYLFDEQLEEAKKWISKAKSMAPADPFIQNTVEKLEDFQAYKTIEKKLKVK